MINQNLKILLLCNAQDYNQEISHVILSQIFDTSRNAYCILSAYLPTIPFLPGIPSENTIPPAIPVENCHSNFFTYQQ